MAGSLGLLAASCSGPSEDDTGERAALEAFAQLAAFRGGAPATCRAEGKRLRYVGTSDTTLQDCLLRNADAEAVTITSPGGSVGETMAAARLIAERGIAVEVLAFCGSSCGNYVVAATPSLTVLPYSVIMLQGAPRDADDQAHDDLRAVALQGGVPEDQVTEEALEAVQRQLRWDQHAHLAFVAEFWVGPDWFALPFFDGAAPTADGMILVASPGFADICLALPAIDGFWYPENRSEAMLVESAIEQPIYWTGLDTAEPTGCGWPDGDAE